MGVLSGLSNVSWVGQVPVLQAVPEHTMVKRVMELAFHSLEVSVTVGVGLLVGRHVCDYHLELWRKSRRYYSVYLQLHSYKF